MSPVKANFILFLVVFSGLLFIWLPGAIYTKCKDRSGDTLGYQKRKDQKRPSSKQLNQLSETIEELCAAITSNSLPTRTMFLNDRIEVLRAKRMQLREIDDGIAEADQLNLFAKQKRQEDLSLRLNKMVDETIRSVDSLVSE